MVIGVLVAVVTFDDANVTVVVDCDADVGVVLCSNGV